MENTKPKTILGLDLGTNSIGWALVEQNEDKSKIFGMGSRIIPLTPDEKDEFSKGNDISKNKKRTIKRTQRKGYDRYQLRRRYLIDEFAKHSMLPDKTLVNLDKLKLWEIRSKAAEGPVTIPELGRILLHLNQKRGYKSSRSDANLNLFGLNSPPLAAKNNNFVHVTKQIYT